MITIGEYPIPATMRVMKLSGTGLASSFEPAETEVPQPSTGEFLVRVSACGVCGHDALARRGELSAAAGDVLGHEISGTVVATGSNELREWIGRRVALVQRRPCGRCFDCQRGTTSQCRQGPGFYGDDIPGGYSEFVLADPLNAVQLPDSIDDVDAAILSCGIGTGLRALRAAEVQPPGVVVVTGAGGGVGLHAVQLAAHYGHTVVATTTDAAKVGSINEAGAHQVLVNPTVRDLRAAAAEYDCPRGANAVLEITGAPTFATSLRALAPRGRLVLVGNVRPQPFTLDPGLTIVKELQVIGSAHATRDDLVEVVDLVAAGKIRPVVAAKTYPLSKVADAHAAVDARSIAGRTVVIP